MATIRVRPDIHCVVFWRDTQVVLAPGIAFDDGDAFVKEHPSYFEYDIDAEPVRRVTAVAVGPDAPIEDATARPGEKRTTRRRA